MVWEQDINGTSRRYPARWLRVEAAGLAFLTKASSCSLSDITSGACDQHGDWHRLQCGACHTYQRSTGQEPWTAERWRGWTESQRISQGEPHAFVKFLLLKYTGLLLVGAENRRHPPRRAQGRRFCHADMRPVLVPAWETGLWPRPRGTGGWWPPSPMTWAPEKQSDTSWEGRAGGGGRRSLSQGKLVPPGGGRGPSQTGDGVSVHLQAEDRLWVPRSPVAKPDQSPGPPPPTLPGGPCSPRAGRAEAGW